MNINSLICPTKISNHASTEQSITKLRQPIAVALLLLGSLLAAPTATAEALPAGYVVSGGLTWTPNNILALPWGAANSHCADLSAAGSSDWRLPSDGELVVLTRGVGKESIKQAGWAMAFTWSSQLSGRGHATRTFKDGAAFSGSGSDSDGTPHLVTCVH
ncbi:MAG: hypothetical protein WC742_15255 [Gallionellaceae bacterium]